jgi:hypothetical protein
VLIAKLAVTAQSAVIAPVVYVLPDKVPPQPVTDAMWYPVFGVIVKEAVELLVTVCGVFGLILPLAPADGVTVYALEKVAVTVQLSVTNPVV